MVGGADLKDTKMKKPTQKRTAKAKNPSSVKNKSSQIVSPLDQYRLQGFDAFLTDAIRVSFEKHKAKETKKTQATMKSLKSRHNEWRKHIKNGNLHSAMFDVFHLGMSFSQSAWLKELEIGSKALLDKHFKSGKWFNQNTNIPSARLRQASRKDRKTMRVRKKVIDKLTCYSVADAERNWPGDMKKK